MEKTFLDRQIVLKNRQGLLHTDIQQLLFDLLKALPEKSLDRLVGYNLNNDFTILEVDATYRVLFKVCYFEEYSPDIEDDEDVDYISIENLSQEEQKDLIDFIIENNLI